MSDSLPLPDPFIVILSSLSYVVSIARLAASQNETLLVGDTRLVITHLHRARSREVAGAGVEVPARLSQRLDQYERE
jgi:hypothetical protein